MTDAIIELSDRGQVTIPKKFRDKVVVNRFICRFDDGKIVLDPLQTREEFLAELDAIEKGYQKNGGLSLAEMKKKYDL